MLAVALMLVQADLVVTNARVYTADVNRPTAEAFAVREGRIAFVGSARGALALAGPKTERLDLGGKTVLPGIVDAHAHLLGLGQALRTVDLVGTRSYEEIIARVSERARGLPAGTWIRGRGWDQNDWADTRFTTHEALSKAGHNHQGILIRVDGRAGLVHAKAPQAAQVTAPTKDPDGGRFIRDGAGNPTGVLIDGAQGIVSRAIPAVPKAELREQTLAAITEANRWGLTGIHDA